MFWILKSLNFTGKPSFWRILAYFLAAKRLSSSLLAPVQTIFPELKTKAVVLGSLIRIITAAKLLGLYSAFLTWETIFFKSNGHPRLTLETIFCTIGTISSGSNKDTVVEVVNWVLGGIGLMDDSKEFTLDAFFYDQPVSQGQGQCDKISVSVISTEMSW